MPPVTVKKAQQKAQQKEQPKAAALSNMPEEGGRTGYNFALVCGNRVEIFPPERFHEIQGEVERLLAKGRVMEEVQITLLESEDPWK